VLGVYDVYRGSPDAAIANAVQVPMNDPLLLIPRSGRRDTASAAGSFGLKPRDSTVHFLLI
jgi:hypothetical protein